MKRDQLGRTFEWRKYLLLPTALGMSVDLLDCLFYRFTLRPLFSLAHPRTNPSQFQPLIVDICHRSLADGFGLARTWLWLQLWLHISYSSTKIAVTSTF